MAWGNILQLCEYHGQITSGNSGSDGYSMAAHRQRRQRRLQHGSSDGYGSGNCGDGDGSDAQTFPDVEI